MSKTGPISDFWKRLLSLPSFRHLPNQTEIAKKVANICNVSYGQTAISRWKRGTATPPSEVYACIAVHEKVAFEWLRTGRGPKEPPFGDDPLLPEFLDIWKKLTVPAKQAVFAQAKYFRTISFAGDLEETLDLPGTQKRKHKQRPESA